MSQQALYVRQTEHPVEYCAAPCKLWLSSPTWTLASVLVIWKQDESR